MDIDVKDKLKAIPIPVYDPLKQIKREGLKDKGNYGDEALQAIQVERTRALREKQIISGEFLGSGSDGLIWALENTPREVGSQFQAHGFGLKVDPVQGLEDLLTKGIDPKKTFYTTEFTINREAGPAIGADHPFCEGGIILIGDFGQLIRKKEDIKIVVVGEEFVNVIDLMRERYNNVEIIPWHDAPTKLIRIYNERTGRNLPIVDLTQENRPYYRNKPSKIPIHVDNTASIIPVPQSSGLSDLVEPW